LWKSGVRYRSVSNTSTTTTTGNRKWVGSGIAITNMSQATERTINLGQNTATDGGTLTTTSTRCPS